MIVTLTTARRTGRAISSAPAIDEDRFQTVRRRCHYRSDFSRPLSATIESKPFEFKETKNDLRRLRLIVERRANLYRIISILQAAFSWLRSSLEDIMEHSVIANPKWKNKSGLVTFRVQNWVNMKGRFVKSRSIHPKVDNPIFVYLRDIKPLVGQFLSRWLIYFSAPSKLLHRSVSYWNHTQSP